MGKRFLDTSLTLSHGTLVKRSDVKIPVGGLNGTDNLEVRRFLVVHAAGSTKTKCLRRERGGASGATVSKATYEALTDSPPGSVKLKARALAWYELPRIFFSLDFASIGLPVVTAILAAAVALGPARSEDEEARRIGASLIEEVDSELSALAGAYDSLAPSVRAVSLAVEADAEPMPGLALASADLQAAHEALKVPAGRVMAWIVRFGEGGRELRDYLQPAAALVAFLAALACFIRGARDLT